LRQKGIPGKLQTIIEVHSCLLLDSCLWIYHIEDHPSYSLLTTAILERVAKGEPHAVSSELTLLEIKIHPLRQGREDIAEEYELLMDAFPNFSLCPIDRDILHTAGRLRVSYGLKIPDAIILASGLRNGATCAITNDLDWKRVNEMEILCLDDHLEK